MTTQRLVPYATYQHLDEKSTTDTNTTAKMSTIDKNREASATNGETRSSAGWVSQAAIDEVFGEKEKKPVTIKIKKPGPKLVKPGNWKEPEVEGGIYAYILSTAASSLQGDRREEG